MWAIFRTAGETGRIAAPQSDTESRKLRGKWVLAATILGSGMAFLDGTVVNVALPALQTNLKATALDVQWVIEAHTLLLSTFLLIGGSLGDHYGRRRIFVIGVTLFAAASGACGLADNIRHLIVARAVQGFGAALLVPGSLAIISSSFPEQERGRAIGTWSAFSAMTAGLGPVLGGWLIEHVSWRAVFFINLPLAVAVVWITMCHVVETAERDRSTIDWIGAVLVAIGLGLLVYALIEWSTFGARSVAILLIASASLLSTFVLVETRVTHPMLPLGLFRSATFSGTNLLTFLLYAALGGTLVFLPLNLIQIQHYSTPAAGAALLPFIVIMALLSRWSGGLLTKYGERLPLISGPLVVAVGYLLFALPGVGGSYWKTFFPAIAILGLGMAITVAPLTTVLMNSVNAARAGIASGVNNAVSRTASLIAVAVFGLVMLHVFSRALGQRLPHMRLPESVIEVVLAQSNRLGAIVIPMDINSATRESIRGAIDASFVRGFRALALIGAFLGLASSITAWVSIDRETR